MNGRRVLDLLGVLLLGFAVTFAIPLAWSIVEAEWRSLQSFAVTATLTAGLGLLLRFSGRRESERGTIFRRDALLVVALSWFIVPALGALPFLLDGVMTSPIDAYFESVSGFTTTGATVLTEIRAAMSLSMHIWRLETHWLGGMGIMVLFVAVLPSLGVGGKMLVKNEVTGPISEGLRPRIKDTAAALWWIYVGMTAVQAALLMGVGGMNFHEALGHTFATMGTGGFSTENASIAAYDSIAIDAICTVFMFLAGANFALYYAAMTGRWRAAIRDRELWAYILIVLLSTLVVSLSILPRHGGSLFQAVRYGGFQVVSVITTTGFVTDDFDQYPTMARLLLFVLMFVGGCAGSTAGAIKVVRVALLARAGYVQLQSAFRPNSVLTVKLGGHVIPESVLAETAGFFFAYIAIFIGASLLMAPMTPDFETAITSVAATLGNVGPGLSAVGATCNYGWTAPAGKLLLSFCMLLGRLELYTILVLFSPAFWRK